MRNTGVRRIAAVVAFGLVGAIVLGACVTIPPEPPPVCDKQFVTLNIYAGDNINPNEHGLPRPVFVRIYQLVNDMRMLNAKYDEIFLKDAETLGDDLLQVNEVPVYPNDLVEVKFERNPDASLIAGVALFRDPQGQSWKTYYEFPPMPNAGPCGAAAAPEDAPEPQVAPKTAFFVVENKIDNGSQYDESMFPHATDIRRISLPKKSATSGQQQPGAKGK